MKIAFVNFTPMIYTVNTPYEQPLGGSESSMCYLAEHLAKLGHEVILFTTVPEEVTIRGVLHIPKTNISTLLLQTLDVLVVQNTPAEGPGLRALIGKNTKLILWTGHAPDQPAVVCLQDLKIQASFDIMILVSRIHMESFVKTFGVERKKCWILRNAISPAFENLFTKNEKIIDQKTASPTLAYTSTPFRGLDFLLAMFPSIRMAVPGTTLEVYSSMKVYQTQPEEEVQTYGNLYTQCKSTPGIEYIGSISQNELAKKLKKVLVFSYPNTFGETSCIAVMEAMASGCLIVTSNFGALGETTAGFAKLIEITNDWQQYCSTFIGHVVAYLRAYNTGNRNELNDLLTRQVAFTNACYTWTTRAKEWDLWLKDLVETSS